MKRFLGEGEGKESARRGQEGREKGKVREHGDRICVVL